MKLTTHLHLPLRFDLRTSPVRRDVLKTIGRTCGAKRKQKLLKSVVGSFSLEVFAIPVTSCGSNFANNYGGESIIGSRGRDRLCTPVVFNLGYA